MLDYLDWQSPLSAKKVFTNGETFSYPQFINAQSNSFIYLTQLKNESSRAVLILKTPNASQCLTPALYDLGTKISEYGGKPYWLFGQNLYFVNRSDQCLYRQQLDDLSAPSVQSGPQRVSVKPSNTELFMYSDIIELDNSTLLAIVERQDLSDETAENTSFIAVLNVDSADAMPISVQRGADFYSNLVYHPEDQRIAWVEWDHPNMPWDENRLSSAQLLDQGDGLALVSQLDLDLQDTACVCQLMFSNNGRLFYSADFAGNAQTAQNYWNLYCFDFAKGRSLRVTSLDVEFGYPHWQYGDQRIVQYSDSKLLAIASKPTGDQLVLVDQDSLDFRPLESGDDAPCSIQNLSSNENSNAIYVRRAQNTGPSIVIIAGQDLQSSVVRKNSAPDYAVSLAEHIEYQCSDGQSAYGFYYPPKNSSYDCGLAPPLIVLVHGGPTARAYGHFDVQKQFWTSRGFALFDVNHRGSSGYGRHYRDTLYGAWGEIDSSDIADGVKTLIKKGLADPSRVCIRGKSAGGYAVLRALTEFPEIFKAGASYYGIGNLATLAEVTHKFEKHYTDRLIDEVFNSESAYLPESKFYQRSPIYKLAQLNSAMIIFQGLKDKVVPPSVALEIIDVLKTAGVQHRYVEYADEAHGFRQVSNNVDALGKELEFYRSVLN
ncbi:MAG: dipeptidyl aminopeptidase/acylaminoacyl peptidase [Cryomorphaceae bacterium]|jgi:dipeptidyl aminopeptidase/acylaminoacyl peptidase